MKNALISISAFGLQYLLLHQISLLKTEGAKALLGKGWNKRNRVFSRWDAFGSWEQYRDLALRHTDWRKTRSVRIVTTLVVSLLTVYMIGCDVENEWDIVFPHLDAIPPNGSTIETDAVIRVASDTELTDVKVSAGDVIHKGKTFKIVGPFIPGPLTVIITTEHVQEMLHYTVILPDTDPPKMTSGDLIDGDRDVDHNAINAEARIEFWFSEPVTGNIELQTEDTENVGWLGEVKGIKATLAPCKGEELTCGTAYMIVGKVSDAAGNSTYFSVSFDTQRCP